MNDKNIAQNHISNILTSYIEDLNFEHQNPGKLIGLSTGIKSLDIKLKGLRDGQIILIAGRPAMGKTALAIELAYNIATEFEDENNENHLNDKSLLYFNLKTSNKILAKRFIKNIGNISEKEITKPSNFNNVKKIIQNLADLPIYISDNGYIISEIKEEINKLPSVRCVIIDYLQMIKNNDYSLIMEQLKKIAKQYKIPVIVLFQLDVSLEKRTDKRPITQDVLNSCNLHCIDKILLLFRYYYYLINQEPHKKSKETDEQFKKRTSEWQKKCEDNKTLFDIYISRNIDGHKGLVTLNFYNDTCTFKEFFDDCDALPPL